MNFAGFELLLAMCTYLLQLAGNEQSEYIRIASVQERIISKTSLDASKYFLFCALRHVVD